MRNSLLLFLSALWALSSCSSIEHKAVRDAMNNPEIKQFIENHTESKEKLKAAIFIAGSISSQQSFYDNGEPNDDNTLLNSIEHLNSVNIAANLQTSQVKQSIVYDIDIVRADSLSRSLDASFDVWKQAPWASDYNFSIFCNYVLPYRVSEEPLEYYWKADLYAKYHHLLREEISDPIEIVKKLNTNKLFRFDPDFTGNSYQSYSSIIRNQRGRCNDGALFYVMLLRSLGIPSAIDVIPFWGSNNNSHQMAVIVSANGKCVNVENLLKSKEESYENQFEHKAPKIYRESYRTLTEDILFQHRNKESIPHVFEKLNLIDVTDQYGLDLSSVKIIVPPSYDTHIAYLSVFSPRGWQPVTYTGVRRNRAEFQHIGTGSVNGKNQLSGINIGDGILYLPSVYIEDEVIPVGYPFVLTSSEKRELKPDHENLQQVVLTRKYPRKTRVLSFARQMQGGTLEVANQKDFSDAEIVFRIETVPPSRISTVSITEAKKYRYMRYRKGTKGFSIAELGAFASDGGTIEGKIIASEFFEEDSSLVFVFDNNNLTYFEMDQVINGWVGLDFVVPQVIEGITFCPRTDDNEIASGDLYELFYWDNTWISLGKQQADDYQITYDDVPAGALLWLRNRTKGVEERPFTYENGKQIWW